MKHITLTTLIVLAAYVSGFGQNQGNENSTDRALQGNGRVNSSTLAMEFSLPLGNYPGRGINVPISINYSSKQWRYMYSGDNPDPGGNYSTCKSNYIAMFSEHAASGWTTSMEAPYIEYLGSDNFYNIDGTPVTTGDTTCPTSSGGSGSYPYYYVKRIVVHLPSGETHELRPDDTATSFVNSGTPSEGPQNAGNWNATYYAVDSSNLIYVQNSTNGTYRLLIPDGSYYDFSSSSTHPENRPAASYTDRNGNATAYHTANSTYPNGYWTDTLGRPLAVPFGQQPPEATDPEDPIEYTMPGLGGSYKFHWKELKGASAGESAITTFSDSLMYISSLTMCGSTYCDRTSGTYLFGGDSNARVMNMNEVFNPVLLAEVQLPNGTSYKFSYDVFGRLEWIHYPTGGKEHFTYGLVPTLSMLEVNDISGNTNFGVVERNVYESESDGSPYTWEYSAQYASPHGYRVTIENPDGTSLDRFLHRGIDAGSGEGTFGYDNSLAGMAYEERGFDSAGNMLSRKLTHWTYNEMNMTPNITAKAHWHPRVDYEESALYQADGNGVTSTTKFEYEGNLTYRNTPVLVNMTTQYAFSAITSGNAGYGENFSREATPSTSPTPVPTPTPSASPVRSTEVTYLQNDSNYSGTASYYTAQNMIGLVTVSKVKDGSGTVVSQTETVYDEFSTYPLLSSGATPTGQWSAPANSYRGNPNTVKVWDSAKGAVTSSGNFISTHAQFDKFGNRAKVWDALGNYTTTDFDSTYYTFPLTVTSPVPDSTNTYGSNSAFVTTATFNTTTGLPLTTTDANGLTTAIEYDEDTLRPRYVRYYTGYGTGGQTQVGPTNETIYHDETGNYWVKAKNQIDGSNYAESITYFDGLGRAYKTEQVDSGGNIFVTKEFDSDGRVSRVSNPYREVNADPCYESSAIVCWTTNTYDNASRVVSVALPDTSTVATDYGISTSSPIGITKTITDQAGKKRKGYSDAMGNMVRVVEDPTSSALVTDYLFDTLGNLRKTTQGDQNRYFMHSSIGRLLFAKQVEQDTNSYLSATDPITSNTAWSVKYLYDDNGNITSTTDAKNVTVAAYYDHINRIYNRDYNDSTPDVNFYYDGRGLGSVPNFSNGKTTRVASTVSESRYTGFDIFGRLLSSEQKTPFDTESAADATARTSSYTYNLSGAMLTQTYPSGRVITNNLDENGDLASVWSQESGSIAKVYVNAISRNSAGSITSMHLGNGRWENATYNSREQITKIGLGNSATDSSLLKLEFKYDTTGNHDNNGSMLEQKITVPAVGSNSSFTATQTYAYDALNRLGSSEEKVSGTTTWKQTFDYDRYGNRRFNTTGSNTTTLGSCSTAVCNPTISTSTNRISSSGYTFDANGSITANAAGERFGYDAENHQKEFFTSSNSGSTPDATYSYDGEGKRVKKISSTETVIFVYDGGGQLVAEYSTALASTQQVSYLTQDHLGSPRVITNEIGAVTNRKDFAAFGDQVTSAQRVSGSSGNGYDPASTREDYTGYEKDAESGLEFAQARYYNPAHGRFTSIDPMTASASIKNPQTFNRYSYVLNSPYKFVDPLGLISQTTGACGNGCSNYDSRTWNGVAPFDSLNGRGGERLPAPDSESDSAGGTSAITSTTAGNATHGPQVAASEGDAFYFDPDDKVSDSADSRYNCLAWTLGFIDRWIEPVIDGGGGYVVIFNHGQANFDAKNDLKFEPDTGDNGTNTTLKPNLKTKDILGYFGGKKSSQNEALSNDKYKVVVFEVAGGSKADHVMRQESDGTWSSKNGEGSKWINIGNPVTFFKNAFPKFANDYKVYYYKMPRALLDVEKKK